MQENATSWVTIPPTMPDIRLVVCDMDGTLLDERSQLPEGFWEIHRLLTDNNVVFVPASGRQLATLTHMFQPDDDTQSRSAPTLGPPIDDFIAENGNLVVHSGERIWQNVIPTTVAHDVTRLVREGNAKGRNMGVVMCAADGAYVDRDDDPFLIEAQKYYATLSVVDNVDDIDDDFVKFAIYDFEDAESAVSEIFGSLDEAYQPVVSGKHWIDVMDKDVNKGVALRRLQESLGITREQTAVFGDYLNDREMMAEGAYSFAMENAHPIIMQEASYWAPAHTQAGVIQVLRHLFTTKVPTRTQCPS